MSMCSRVPTESFSLSSSSSYPLILLLLVLCRDATSSSSGRRSPSQLRRLRSPAPPFQASSRAVVVDALIPGDGTSVTAHHRGSAPSPVRPISGATAHHRASSPSAAASTEPPCHPRDGRRRPHPGAARGRQPPPVRDRGDGGQLQRTGRGRRCSSSTGTTALTAASNPRSPASSRGASHLKTGCDTSSSPPINPPPPPFNIIKGRAPALYTVGVTAIQGFRRDDGGARQEAGDILAPAAMNCSGGGGKRRSRKCSVRISKPQGAFQWPDAAPPSSPGDPGGGRGRGRGRDGWRSGARPRRRPPPPPTPPPRGSSWSCRPRTRRSSHRHRRPPAAAPGTSTSRRHPAPSSLPLPCGANTGLPDGTTTATTALYAGVVGTELALATPTY